MCRKRGGNPEGWPASHLGMAGVTPGAGAATGALRNMPRALAERGPKGQLFWGLIRVSRSAQHSEPLGTWSLSSSLANGFITRCFLLCARDATVYTPWGRSLFVLRKSCWILRVWLQKTGKPQCISKAFLWPVSRGKFIFRGAGEKGCKAKCLRWSVGSEAG